VLAIVEALVVVVVIMVIVTRGNDPSPHLLLLPQSPLQFWCGKNHNVPDWQTSQVVSGDKFVMISVFIRY